MWTEDKEQLGVYKARFSKGLWIGLQPNVKWGWATKHAGGRSALMDVAWWDQAVGCKLGEGRGRHWWKGGMVEREVSLVMSILAHKMRPGWSIKPWSTSTNHCGFGLYQLAVSQGNIRAQLGSQWAVWMHSPYFGWRRKHRSVDASHAGSLTGPENRPWLVLFCFVMQSLHQEHAKRTI